MRTKTPRSKVMAASMVTAVPQRETKEPVDREKKCPFLLRVFVSTGRPFPVHEFSRGNLPSNELQIYTWYDATLKELTDLVKECNPEARRRGCFLDFSIVYPSNGRYSTRELGSTCSGRKGQDDSVTLQEKRFIIGDYLNVSLSPPNRGPDVDMRRGSGRMRPY